MRPRNTTDPKLTPAKKIKRDGNRIYPQSALDLEAIFPEIPAEFWLRVDISYRLNVARLARLRKMAS